WLLKKKRFALPTLLYFCLLCCVLTFAFTVLTCRKLVNRQLEDYQALKSSYQKLIRMDQIVRENFVYDIDEQYLSDYILAGYAYGLKNDYSYYLTEADFAKSSDSIGGDFAGIGIRVLPDEQGLIHIANVMIGSPAAEAGLQNGDRIAVVEGRPVGEIGYNQAVNDLLGTEGTQAHFEVLRGDGQLDFAVTRRKFALTTVVSRVLDSGYGYIRIYEFDLRTLEQFNTALDALLGQGVPGIVFDMRENPGGELKTICSVLDRLVPEGVIIEIADKQGTYEQIRSDARELDLPMAVITNENTASAAELFSATLRDYDKAVLVGTRTFGKGSVQTIFPLGDNTGLSLTTGLYFPPSGESYDGEGIAPDVEVTLPEELHKKIYYLEEPEDVQLQAAVQALEQAA
ncbi:MAG: S41 family peptidase, partial [Clostridiales bacterium]|nr:S41 family peptidase [Clostridiales bacterium]